MKTYPHVIIFLKKLERFSKVKCKSNLRNQGVPGRLEKPSLGVVPGISGSCLPSHSSLTGLFAQASLCLSVLVGGGRPSSGSPAVQGQIWNRAGMPGVPSLSSCALHWWHSAQAQTPGPPFLLCIPTFLLLFLVVQEKCPLLLPDLYLLPLVLTEQAGAQLAGSPWAQEWSVGGQSPHRRPQAHAFR